MSNNNQLKSEEDKRLEDVAKALYTSMKGIGTNENTLIKQTVAMAPTQRQRIKDIYFKMYTKNLMVMIKNDTSGLFYDTMYALYTDPNEFEALLVHEAISVSNIY